MSTYKKLFVIGAARSGTNILRDTLSSIPGFHTWPCDEINPILMHGNLHKTSDVLTQDDASSKITDFIIRAFNKEAKKVDDLEVLVEKTCANSVRLPFLNAIFPDAYYIWIVRDGRDSVSSSRKLWQEGTTLGYKLRKIRYIPISDAIYYFDEYFLGRMKSKKATGAIHNWGVNVGDSSKYCESFDDDFIQECTAKWLACYEHTSTFFEGFDQSRVIKVKYEDFVAQPKLVLEKVCESMLIDNPQGVIEKLVEDVSPRSIGKYKEHLTDNEIAYIEGAIRTALSAEGYPL